MIPVKLFSLFVGLLLFLFSSPVYAIDYQCVLIGVYHAPRIGPTDSPTEQHSSISVDSATGAVTIGDDTSFPAGIYVWNVTVVTVGWYNGSWRRITQVSAGVPVTASIPTATFDWDGSTNAANLVQSLYSDGCPNLCSEKEGTSAGYSTETYKEGSSPSLLSQCLDGCYATAEKVQDLGPCLNSSCITSIKYTYTGTACTEPDLPDIDDNPPDPCYEQFIALANQCGGSGLINSFDWSTCSGSCDSLDCSGQWNSLKDRCGDVTNIEFWNYRNCTGGCKSDPKPDVENSDAPPSDITTKTETHEDGSKTVTDTKTYNIDNTTYTNTTTTTYDSSGNQTGSSNTLTTSGGSDNGQDSDSDDSDDDNDEPTYDMPSSWYTKTYDISNGLASAIDYQQVINATESFKNTALYQVPNLILECLGYVEGDGCEYPPVLTVDFHNSFTNDPIEVDLAPFESVVKVMKFFFSILCIIGTGKAVMALFN